MGAVAAGLIGATAIKLAKGLKTSVLGWRWCTAFGLGSLLAIAALRVPLVYVIFGLGGLACALAYRKLQP
jgi:chromate transporter